MTLYHFPKDKDYIFAVADIRETYGGLTTAMLNRARLFTEKGSISVRIITFNFEPDYSRIRRMLTDQKIINEQITILNMYDFFSGDLSSTEEDAIPLEQDTPSIAEAGYLVEKVGKRNDYRYFKNGLLSKLKCFDPHHGGLKYIDYYDQQLNRTMREEYDRSGRKRRVTYYHAPTNQKRQELYFDQTGRCFLTKWFKNVDKTSSLDKIYWFDKQDGVKQVFNSDIEMRCFWMTELIQNRETFLFADARSTDPAVMSLKGDHIYKIMITHSIHVRPPYHAFSDIRTGNRPVLSQAGKADAIVLLTHFQKRDIEARFGATNNLFVIPHAYEGPKTMPDFAKRNLKKAVVVARYHKEKQLDHIIKAFAQVVSHHSDAYLECYGFGPELQRLNKLIKDWSLEGNVKLMGETNQPGQVFESAAFSVMTSQYEGFGLAVLESLAHACPVLAYDIKYGPSDMITDHENGRLLPADNIDMLASVMIDLFSRPNKLEEMSQAAFEGRHGYNEHEFLTRWRSLLEKVVSQKQRRNHLTGIDFHLTDSDWSSPSLGVYKVIGEMSLHGGFPEETIPYLDIQFKIQHRETKEFFYWPAEVKRESHSNKWLVHGVFPTFQMYHNYELPKGPWDVNIAILWNNSYFDKRIGYQKTEKAAVDKTATKTPHNMVIQPYYTKPYGNLTFHVKNNIVQKVIQQRGQAINKLAEWIKGK